MLAVCARSYCTDGRYRKGRVRARFGAVFDAQTAHDLTDGGVCAFAQSANVKNVRIRDLGISVVLGTFK